MSPQARLRIANLFMLVGLAPLLLGVYWMGEVIAYAQHHKGQMGGSDAFLMMGVLFITYAFAFVISGSSALWSISIVRRHAGLHTVSATVIKSLVGIALLAPWLWVAAERMFRF